MKNKARLCRATLIALVLLLCVGGVVGAFSVREQRLQQAQQKAISQLEEYAGEYRPEVLVLENTTPERAEELAARFGATLRTTTDGTFATLSLPQGQSAEQIFYDKSNRDILSELSLDVLCEVDEEAEPDAAPPPQWPNYPVTDTLYTQQLNMPYVGLGGTWSATQGKFADGTRVTVAIVDSGIDVDHPEFFDKNGRCIISEKSYNALTDSCVETEGWNVINDTRGHGTAVAGVIAAQMNGSGVVGIAPDVELLIIKADNSEGRYWSSDMTFGINYAVQQGAHVVSMSISGTAPNTGNSLQNAVNNNVIVVVSAGNEGNAVKRYPASDPLSIGVGALARSSWTLADYSSYGENSDLVAPGTNVYTTAIGGGYKHISGTSFSCPTVAAAVALYIAHHGVTSYENVRRALLSSCIDLGDPGEDDYFGHGALNIEAFVGIDFVDVHFDYRAANLENITLSTLKGNALQTQPTLPEREGLRLEGFYLDQRLTQRVDITTQTFNSDITLYARWLGAEYGDFDYVERSGDTVEILTYRGTQTMLQIPEQINNKRVTAIGHSAFRGCDTLRSVTLPKDISFVAEEAFAGCDALQSVSVNSRLLIRKVGEKNAAGCLFENATTILIPTSMKNVAGNAMVLYPKQEQLTIDGNTYLKLSDHQTKWEQAAVLTPHIACKQDGIILLQCTGCATQQTKIIPMHSIGDFVVEREPACVEAGSKVKQCTLCHVTLETESIPALGHAQVRSPAIPAGCETEGYTPQQCSRCGLQTRIYVVPPKGHTHGEWVTVQSPTKTEDGSKQCACTVCDKVLETEALAAYTHLLDFEAAVAALTGAVTAEEFEAIADCIAYYNALTDAEKAAAAQERALLAERIATYNTNAQAKNAELGNTTKAAASVLGEVQNALGGLWYSFKQNRKKEA